MGVRSVRWCQDGPELELRLPPMDVTDHERGAQDRRAPAASQGVSNGADPNPAETSE